MLIKRKKLGGQSASNKPGTEAVISKEPITTSTPKQNTEVSINRSVSCLLLSEQKCDKVESKGSNAAALPTKTSSRSIQVAPPKKVKIDPKATKKLSPSSSKEIQVDERKNVLTVYTSQAEILPEIHGDSIASNRTSPTTLTVQSRTQVLQSGSCTLSKPIQKKRACLNMSPPLLRTKAVTAKDKKTKGTKPPGPLASDSSKSLQLPANLIPSGCVLETVKDLPPKVAKTSSSQTIESWPILEKRLNLFEKTKKKMSREKIKEKSLTSTFVQATPTPIKRSNVKCLVYVEQGSKTTQATIGPSGMDRIESCMNTEKSDSNSGIQCDIALRRTMTPKKSTSRKIYFTGNAQPCDKVTPADSGINVLKAESPARESVTQFIAAATRGNLAAADVKREDVITVLPTRRTDPRTTRSDNACIGELLHS